MLAERVAIAIYPDRVVWLRVSKGLRPRVLSKGIVACDTQADSLTANISHALTQALQAAKAEKTGVSVILSNRLLRYAIIPNPDSTRNPQELKILVQHIFQHTHGDIASTWDFRLSDGAPGEPALACAIDRELLMVLQNVTKSMQARLLSVRPYLMAALNHFSTSLPKSGAIFVTAEPERLCLAAWKAKGWRAIQQAYTEADWVSNLQGMADRLAISADLNAQPMLKIFSLELELATHAEQVTRSSERKWKSPELTGHKD